MGLTRGRLVADAGGAVIGGPEARPSALRRAEAMEARAQAAAVVAAAHTEAERVRAHAIGEATRVRQEAEQQALAAGEAALAARWVELKRAEQIWEREREGDLLAVARLLAERLLGRALETDSRAIVDLARQALEPLRRARRLQLSVHPDVADALRAGLASLGHEARSIEVHLEPTAPRGAVHVVSELGSIRAELAPQLDRLLAALRGP